MGKMNVTTSISEEIYQLAVEKNLKWNEMLILGIKTCLNQPFELKDGEKIEDESYKAKYEASLRREAAYQRHIEELMNEKEVQKQITEYGNN